MQEICELKSSITREVMIKSFIFFIVVMVSRLIRESISFSVLNKEVNLRSILEIEED